MSKTSQKIRNTVLPAVLLVMLVFASCKKDKTPDPTPDPNEVTPTGTLMMHLHTYIGINEVDAYNIVYTNESDRKISLSMAQMYISGIELVKADGSIYSLSDVKVLKVFETETYFLADVPMGNYKSVKFKVGLDAATNGADPSTSALLNHAEMWMNTTAQPDGYVFLNAQGKIDTTADATGSVAQMQNFIFKIGTNAHYVQVNMPDQNFTILKDQVEYLHLYADYSKLFNGINLHQILSVSSVADNSTPMGNAVANNIPSIFSYE